MTEKRVPVSGIEVSVREWGRTSGVPLIYLHGRDPFAALHLIEVGERWGEAGLRVIAPVIPGFADGPRPLEADFFMPSRLARFVLSLSDALELSRFCVAGWSWGATIAVHTASQAPGRVAALILLDAGHTVVEATGSREKLEKEFASAGNIYADWDELFTTEQQRRRRWGPALRRRVKEAVIEQDGQLVLAADPIAAAWAYWGSACEPSPPLLPTVATSGTPTLLVRSDEADDGDALNNFTKAIPHATLLTVSAGHDVIADAPDVLADRVPTWLFESLERDT